MAARQAVFSHPTTLYHPIHGAQVFGIGEMDPGNAWFDEPVENRVGKNAAAGAAADVALAHEELARLSDQMDTQTASMAELNAAKLEAEGKVDGLEQRAIAAESAQKTAEDTAATVTRERNEARGEAETQKARADKLDADLKAATELTDGIAKEAEDAKQALADANGRIQELETDLANAKAKIAKVDGDGDGNPGGSKKSAAKSDDKP